MRVAVSRRQANGRPIPSASTRCRELSKRAERREWYDSLLDRLDTFRVLRADDEATKSELLEELAVLGEPEQDIARELLAAGPLAQPERFEKAHRDMARGLEVLERNGGRRAKIDVLGPFDTPASVVASAIAGWITKRYRHTLIGEIRGLYEAREANARPGSPEHRMLRRARLQATSLEHGYGSAQIGIPGFLLGGAALSTSFAVVRNWLGSIFQSTAGTVLVTLVLAAIVLGISWAFFYGAAVARRRIKLSTDGSAAALWQAIGACGDPPRDHSLGFAGLAVALVVVSWLAVPVAIWVLFG